MAEREGQTSISATLPPQDCLACRVIGTGALGGVGIYALGMTRAGAPGSPLGKRIMGAVGVGT